MAISFGLDDPIQRELLEAIDSLKEPSFKIAQSIHEKPELGFSEFFAVKLLAEAFEAHGVKIEKGVAGLDTAFLARAKGRGAGPKIGLRTEYDALAGIGHGCAHNLIAAASFATVAGIAKVIDRLDGEVIAVGSPAEEGGGGKIIMIEAGVFRDLDAVLAVHHGGGRNSIATEPGTGRILGMTPVSVEFFGKAAHAGQAPHEGINALNAVMMVFAGIDALRQHVPPDVRIHGIITKGGDAPNVVPDYASAKFLVRAADHRLMGEVVQKVENIVKGAELMTGARATTKIGMAYKPLRPNITLGRLFAKNMEEVGLRLSPLTGAIDPVSTDLGNVSHEVPTGSARFAISESDIPGHSLDVVHGASSPLGLGNMLLAAKAMALTALDLLTKPEILVEAKKEFASLR